MICPFCSGRMETKASNAYNTPVTLVAIFLGIFFCLSMQVYLGVPMLFIGLIMAYTRKAVWRCAHCRSAIEKALVSDN